MPVCPVRAPVASALWAFLPVRAAIAALPAPAGREVIQNKGSDTLVNVAQAWAEEYQQVDPSVVVAVSGGKVTDGRERSQESLVVGQDGLHLGLLQHDLGNPYPVRRAWVLPGQVLAPIFAPPFQQTLVKGRDHRSVDGQDGVDE